MNDVRLFLPIRALFFALFVFFAFLAVSRVVSPVRVNASGFTVRTVGGLNVDGLVYTHLWYTKTSVTFTGGTLPNTVVTATVDGAAATATSDATGNWTYSTTLTDGDHTVSLSSIASTVSFTLTIGPVPSGVGGLPTTQAPTVGNAIPTLVLVSIGAGLLLLPLWKMRKSQQA